MSKLPNEYQTKEERRTKYLLCRSLGWNASHSASMRDWRWKALLFRLNCGHPYTIIIQNKMLRRLDNGNLENLEKQIAKWHEERR